MSFSNIDSFFYEKDKNEESIEPSIILVKRHNELFIEIKNFILRCYNIDKKYFDHFSKNIPSPNPVSLNTNNFFILKKHEYFISEKSDGVRYLLLFYKFKNHYLTLMINRRWDMFLIDVCFNNPKLYNSLFDGELVERNVTIHNKNLLIENGKRYVYMGFDTILFENVNLMKEDVFAKRLDCIKKVFPMGYSNIVDLNEYEYEKKKLVGYGKIFINYINNMLNNYLFLEPKVFYDLRYDEWCDILKHCYKKESLDKTKVGHSTDGLIFMPKFFPIMTKIQKNIFKWKYEFTIDFYFKYKNKNNKIVYLLGLMEKGHIKSYKNFEFKEFDSPLFLQIIPNNIFYELLKIKKEYENIVEFKIIGYENVDNNKEKKSILFLEYQRERNDKQIPNNKNTFLSTISNFKNNISINQIKNLKISINNNHTFRNKNNSEDLYLPQSPIQNNSNIDNNSEGMYLPQSPIQNNSNFDINSNIDNNSEGMYLPQSPIENNSNIDNDEEDVEMYNPEEITNVYDFNNSKSCKSIMMLIDNIIDEEKRNKKD